MLLTHIRSYTADLFIDKDFDGFDYAIRLDDNGNVCK